MTHPDLVSVMCRIFFAQPLDRRTRTRHGDADALGRVLPRCVYLASRMRPARLRRRLRARRPRERPRPPGSGARKNHRVALTTMPSTRPTLGVSFWPDFDYDASGATTLGVVGDPDPSNPGAVHLVFDVTTFEGPPVCGRTTKVFGVPLPPGIRVDVVPLSLEGWLDPVTGACALEFDAEFRGSIFGENFIRLPPMTVRSPLTTGVARGPRLAKPRVPFGRTPRPDTSRTSDSTSDLDDPSTRERRRRRRDVRAAEPVRRRRARRRGRTRRRRRARAKGDRAVGASS